MPGKNDIKSKLKRYFEEKPSSSNDSDKQQILNDLRAKLDKIQKHSEVKKYHNGHNNAEYNKPIEPLQNYDFNNFYYDVSEKSFDGIFSLESVGTRIHDSENITAWENSFAHDHKHGDTLIGALKRINTDILLDITMDQRFKDFKHSSALFLDTETTGLAGGTGTLAFLVGLGYYSDNDFIVRQYFMRDYNIESETLNLMADFISNFDYIVSFNGRGFDVPLLESRFIINRIKTNLSSLPHLDLLYPSRSIFKKKLENCRLQTLEKDVLRFFREEDIPSDEIPYLYFRYLRSKNPSLMDKVFYHNNMDIVSLSALTTRVVELFDHTIDNYESGEELLGIAQHFNSRGNLPMARFFLETAMQYDLSYDYRKVLLKELSLIMKKNGEYDSAAEIWNGMIEGLNDFDIFPFEEIAKYYEHIEKSFQKASITVIRAVEFLNSHKGNLTIDEFVHYQRRLLHRLKRLENKLHGKPWK